MLHKDPILVDYYILAMPPRQSNEEFLEAYKVVLILDDRENFGFV
jgi:crossover junction endonuclease MUS81